MAAQTIRVRGYRETARAFNRVNVGAKAALYAGLKKAAEPIAESARARLSGYAGLNTGSIGPRVTTTGVYVTQRQRKKTGTRPDFGALQMRRGLIPALSENESDVAADVETAFMLLAHSQRF